MQAIWALLKVTVLLAASVYPTVVATGYEIQQYFIGIDTTCESSTPYLSVLDGADCTADVCVIPFGDRITTTCTDDYKAYVGCMSKRVTYLLQETFLSASDCADAAFAAASAIPATGDCVGRPANYLYRYARVVLESNGSVTINSYNDTKCDDGALAYVDNIAADVIESYSCDNTIFTSSYENKFSVYQGGNATDCDSSSSSSESSGGNTATGSPSSSADGGVSGSSSTSPVPASSTDSELVANSSDSATSNTGSGISTGAAVGIGAGVATIAVIVVVIVLRRRRTEKTASDAGVGGFNAYPGGQSPTEQLPTAPSDSNSTSMQPVHHAPVGLWDDDAITTSRIPREFIQIQRLLSRGAFGEVFLGVFDGEQVAVKMLRPELRKSTSHINEFLAEVKLSATMEHPNIVRYIGVSWKVLADLCVVMEFMDGGDLRSVLSKYQAENAPQGFNRAKATVAFQVCHALAYMHSLSPPVIHRDLKSRNILLTRRMEAKLADFGTSRERHDRTMTSGVGTLLWMAPEVMMGKRYDDKADIFSFGVILSELDMHTMPYATASDKSGARYTSDTAIIHQVALGQLSVDFSDAGPTSMVHLGRECVSVDPSQRPTTAQALYRLQTILARDLAE